MKRDGGGMRIDEGEKNVHEKGFSDSFFILLTFILIFY
jgi:hypothetical protein